MKFSKRVNIALILILILITIASRYPVTPHEKGSDSFGVHWNAQTINNHGLAPWILDPLSYVGLYPFSQPAGIPFLLSSFSQIADINIETTIMIFAIIFGIIGCISTYLLAKEFLDDDLFAFAVALTFTLAPIFLLFTQWSMSTRGPFMAFAPLFTWVLLRINKQSLNDRFIALTIAFYFLLAVTHRMVVLVIPIIIFSFLFAKFGYKMQSILRLKYKLLLKYILFTILSLIATLLVLSAFHINLLQLLGLDMLLPRWASGRFSSFGVLGPLMDMGFDYSIRISALLIFGIVGIYYLLSKPKRSFNEIFLATFLLLSAPFFLDREYFLPISIAFISIFIMYGLFHVKSRFDNTRFKKISLAGLVTVILIGASFSVYFVYLNNRESDDPFTTSSYLDPEIYNAGLWIRYEIPEESRGIVNMAVIELMLADVGNANVMINSELITEPEIRDNLYIERYSLFEIISYHKGYFWGGTVEDWFLGNDLSGTKHEWYIHQNINGYRKELLNRYNVTYVYEFVANSGAGDNMYGNYWDNGPKQSPFLSEVHDEKYRIFDNGWIQVYNLESYNYN